MYLATGFGIDVISGVKHEPNVYDEEYYKMMVMQDPCNPLFSKNYAQFLQSEGDVTGAEEYYLRAIKQDPKDGEILMQYGKLIWELHCDQDRALSYFEKAVVAAPGDRYNVFVICSNIQLMKLIEKVRVIQLTLQVFCVFCSQYYTCSIC
ncbi:uncharacterized protein [Rutidosis leptorrhynchoides]|uniref:uncharacterized protein isoform X1 n=1 Tax=Rutidosis leptorrhynchoides TaxID=125765 RepID=UPI003A9A082B